MPRQFALRGDRLAFSWGIVVLAAIAGGLLVVFQGDTHLLIPLYSVGVFVCFTLSQVGMVRHWFAVRDSGWWWRAVVNAFGGLLTLLVLVIVASVKFAGRGVARPGPHPDRRSRSSGSSTGSTPRPGLQLASCVPTRSSAPPHREERVVIPVNGLNRSVVQAVNVGPLHLRRRAGGPRRGRPRRTPRRSGTAGSARFPGVPLVVVESPYRALTGPLLAYLDVLDQAWPPDKEAPITFVVIPEYVPRHWWERILYNQSTNQLRRALLGRPNTVVTNVPYRREEASVFRRTDDQPPGP